MDDHTWRTGPGLWDGWNAVAKGGAVHLVDEDTEESGGFFGWVRLELGADLDDEGGSDGGEQTSLRHVLIHVPEQCRQLDNIRI